ncbi:putative RNA binding protein Pym [Aspergillus clavatus NRRL 1]|uniref:RNA binding protein Pym, putative n=1 Tax=Aspergillus clavatus (strain ATCC 1007 / CBS 513.65 / DSM 816 / NCTC 3887 / NRRL 1 / QM 1276 / 107) TaxID=344612 RepID=A1CT96_ASPCL|nr:RNA binding protein Pym, putative [Aspergillus clavatus NRRL 1]EAW06533.1 RNA binding protein Pym, putative [Aspergillus clavatus NRRL 1]
MAPTNSGITEDAQTGERYIPSSVRADGSKRREIRVRPGYRPPEDVELYKNRAAAAWRNRGTGGVPGAEGLNEVTESKANTAASNKNAKRREAKKKAKTAEGAESTTTANGQNVRDMGNWRSGAPAADKKEAAPETQPEVDPEAEKEKKARNLKKKLRQARDLRDKKNQGEALLPEQLEKVIKIQELIRQLDALGFDSEGEKKGATEEKEKEKRGA